MSPTVLLQTPPQGCSFIRPRRGPLTTPEAVQRIADNPDPVRRNLQITQSYHELTWAFHRLYGGTDMVWPLFATWASKQAGKYIRNEEVPAPLRRFLGLDSRRGSKLSRWAPTALLRRSWLQHRLLRYARMTGEDVSGNIAEGNRRVYAQLGPLYARFLQWVPRHSGPDPMRLAEFLTEVRRDPEAGEELPRAFAQYYAALYERDPKRRSERMLLANLLVGWHEQIHLQKVIDGAFRAPVRRAIRSLVLGRLLAPLLRRFENDWTHAATECLMILRLPDRVLWIGDDLPPLPDGSLFPSTLRSPSLPSLVEVLNELDRTRDSLQDTGAHDWTSLEDRMNYLADYFRSRQQDLRLLRTPPFTETQTEAIRAGRLPAGQL